jgi:hypothetical protein
VLNWQESLMVSEATGGNFKDHFIGAAAGTMLSPVSGNMNKNLGFGKAGTGSGWQLLGRTATAATVGGTVTANSGGKFGNGAATAAFMHLVNHEAGEWLALKKGQFHHSARVAALYDGAAGGDGQVATNGAQMQLRARAITDHRADLSNPSTQRSSWQSMLDTFAGSEGLDHLVIVAHGLHGSAYTGGNVSLQPDSLAFESIVSSMKHGGVVVLATCWTGQGAKGTEYLQSLAISSRHKGLTWVGFTGALSCPRAKWEPNCCQVFWMGECFAGWNKKPKSTSQKHTRLKTDSKPAMPKTTFAFYQIIVAVCASLLLTGHLKSENAFRADQFFDRKVAVDLKSVNAYGRIKVGAEEAAYFRGTGSPSEARVILDEIRNTIWIRDDEIGKSAPFGAASYCFLRFDMEHHLVDVFCACGFVLRTKVGDKEAWYRNVDQDDGFRNGTFSLAVVMETFLVERRKGWFVLAEPKEDGWFFKGFGQK